MARDIVFLEAVGINPVVVHGGGKAITRALETAGMKAEVCPGPTGDRCGDGGNRRSSLIARDQSGDRESDRRVRRKSARVCRLGNFSVPEIVAKDEKGKMSILDSSAKSTK